MGENVSLEIIFGRRETTGEQSDNPLWRTYERVPDWDVFLVNGQFVSREVFEAKARQLQELTAHQMKSKKLTPGTRVRLSAPSPLLQLSVDTGVIARPGTRSGYYVVRLDQPARYRRADGEIETLYEVREAGDNLTVIETARTRHG